MATPKKDKKILDRKQVWKEQRTLAKALRDLNQFFSAKSLAKKFKIKPSQVYYYKQYRKRRPFPKEKREKIIEFWEYLKRAPKREDLIHHYKVRKGRLKPSPSVSFEITNKVIKKVGVEKLAKRLRVKPETVKRWQEKGTLGSSLKIKKKIFQKFQKYYKRWVGLFFIREKFKVRGKKEPEGYCKIVYARHFNGSKENLIDYVISHRVYGKVNKNQIRRDSLIADLGKFKEKKVAKFFNEYLPRVAESKLASSLTECYEFLKENFKGKKLERLTQILKEYEK
jgi:hypothetical protein